MLKFNGDDYEELKKLLIKNEIFCIGIIKKGKLYIKIEESHLDSFDSFMFKKVESFKIGKKPICFFSNLKIKVNDLTICSICLDKTNFGKQIEIKTNCKHFFHKECFTIWMKQCQTCPVCRKLILS